MAIRALKSDFYFIIYSSPSMKIFTNKYHSKAIYRFCIKDRPPGLSLIFCVNNLIHDTFKISICHTIRKAIWKNQYLI